MSVRDQKLEAQGYPLDRVPGAIYKPVWILPTSILSSTAPRSCCSTFSAKQGSARGRPLGWRSTRWVRVSRLR